MRRVLASLVVALIGVLGACSDDDDGDRDDAAASSSTTDGSTSSTTAAADGGDGGEECSDEEILDTSAGFFVDPNAGPGAPPPSIIGLADVDGDGNGELWAHTGAGASTTIVGLARRDGCTLTRILGESGEPAAFAVGGSVGTASGVACSTTLDPDAHLAAFELSNIGGDEYEVTATEYTLEGATLVETASDSGSVQATDPSFGRYTGFTCGDLTTG